MRAASLFGVFLLAKVLILAGRDIPLSLWTPIAYVWQDLLVALIFYLLEAAVRRRWFGWALYATIVLYAAVNVPVARVMSSPMTWTMMRGARVTLADSIKHHCTPANLALVASVLVASSMLPVLFGKVRLKPSAAGLLPTIAFIVAGPWATSRFETVGLHRNAVAALVTTGIPRLAARYEVRDWRESPFESKPAEDITKFRRAAAGRNVVLVFLESAGAQYLRAYGAVEDPTPNLTRLAGKSILFENAYAVYPESIKGLFSALCSQSPAFDTAPETYGRVPCTSLATILARAGYHTALFHSGRFAYLGMESILHNRGFQTLEDAGTIGGDENSSFGVEEPASIRRALSWIDSIPKGEKFFFTYLPIAGHHPYNSPVRGPFPEKDEVGRYRNALHYGDAALGELISGFEIRGLEQNTLLLIAGDHGEAFGQHEGNYGHTQFVYEENVRVPFLVTIPGIVQDQVRVTRVASLIDVAPTILDLLGLPVPSDYQGSSLLEDRHRMALFFTDYSVGLAGLRDECWKCIYELDSGRSKLFNLCKDAQETIDLASRFPRKVAFYSERLRGWLAAQRSLITLLRLN